MIFNFLASFYICGSGAEAGSDVIAELTGRAPSFRCSHTYEPATTLLAERQSSPCA
jgi:hypothetical protein